jgi:hypothetical protein
MDCLTSEIKDQPASFEVRPYNLSANLTTISIVSDLSPELVFGSLDAPTIKSNIVTDCKIISDQPSFYYRTDDQGRYIYHGKAEQGQPEASSSWRIYRIDTDVQPNHLTEKAEGDNFTTSWSDRLTLTYT